MNPAEITGTIAVACSFVLAGSMVFQITKIRKRKSSKDVSVVLFLVVVLAYATWFLHGIFAGNKYLIISQGPGLLLALIAFYNILKFRRGDQNNGL